eukprot:TRINITY_DN5715_c0_g3_i2.p1 TRINITY_DN5715_c0_g3~~TRINITY_DN5715_c0_g3_i2.p1  ORF type:complete len:132 (+),score=15.12 TRINITY_DN5715_c0_g3_i2:124-519(+)
MVPSFPYEDLVVSGHTNGKISIWDLRTGRAVSEYTNIHASHVNNLVMIERVVTGVQDPRQCFVVLSEAADERKLMMTALGDGKQVGAPLSLKNDKAPGTSQVFFISSNEKELQILIITDSNTAIIASFKSL